MERELRKTLKNGKFTRVDKTVAKRMSAIKAKGNRSTELKFKMAIVRSGINGWKLSNIDLPGKPDFYFPKFKLAVFVDGCFWHGCIECAHPMKTNTKYWSKKITKNKERDKNKSKELNALGIKVLRFWEHELEHDIAICLRKIIRLYS